MISFEWCIFRSLYFHAYKERSRMHNPITHTSLNDIAPNSSLQVDYIFIFHSVGSCFPFLFRVVPFVSFHQNTSRERERESERSRGRNCSSKTSVAPENTSIGWLHTWFTYALLNSYECSLCAYAHAIAFQYPNNNDCGTQLGKKIRYSRLKRLDKNAKRNEWKKKKESKEW